MCVLSASVEDNHEGDADKVESYTYFIGDIPGDTTQVIKKKDMSSAFKKSWTFLGTRDGATILLKDSPKNVLKK